MNHHRIRRYRITKFYYADYGRRIEGKRRWDEKKRIPSRTFTSASDDKAKERFLQFCRGVFNRNSGAYAPSFFGERKIYDGVYAGALLRRFSPRSRRSRIIDELDFRDFNPSLYGFYK